jgi:hypothetical protein
MKPIIALMLWMEGICYLLTVLFFGYLAIGIFVETQGSFTLILFYFGGIGLLYFFVSKTYFKRVSNKEILIVDAGSLEITEKWLFATRSNHYPIEEISHLGFAGQEQFTENQISKNSYDVTGLGAREKELQYLIQDGTLTFFNDGVTRRFGKNVAEEDAEEIIARMERFTGRNLSGAASVE